MSKPHSIAWLNQPGYIGATLNPIRARLGKKIGWHCEKIAAGCQHCYAETINGRFGTGAKYATAQHVSGYVTPFLDEQTLEKPLRWRKPRCIFWGDMTDLFGDWVADKWLDKCFGVMALTPQHRHILLTKRPKRMRTYTVGRDPRNMYDAAYDMAAHAMGNERWEAFENQVRWPLPNVWLGYSASTQADLEAGIPELLYCPAAVRLLSLEPLLEPLDLYNAKRDWILPIGRRGAPPVCPGIDLVIVGGESGPKARPCNTEWIYRIIEQCRAARVAVFIKQLGARCMITSAHCPVTVPANVYDLFGYVHNGVAYHSGWAQTKHRSGGDPAEWPEDLRVKEFLTKYP